MGRAEVGREGGRVLTEGGDFPFHAYIFFLSVSFAPLSPPPSLRPFLISGVRGRRPHSPPQLPLSDVVTALHLAGILSPLTPLPFFPPSLPPLLLDSVRGRRPHPLPQLPLSDVVTALHLAGILSFLTPLPSFPPSLPPLLLGGVRGRRPHLAAQFSLRCCHSPPSRPYCLSTDPAKHAVGARLQFNRDSLCCWCVLTLGGLAVAAGVFRWVGREGWGGREGGREGGSEGGRASISTHPVIHALGARI